MKNLSDILSLKGQKISALQKGIQDALRTAETYKAALEEEVVKNSRLKRDIEIISKSISHERIEFNEAKKAYHSWKQGLQA